MPNFQEGLILVKKVLFLLEDISVSTQKKYSYGPLKGKKEGKKL